MKEGAEFLSDLVFDQKKQERCLQLMEGSDRVHLANLHKVKGLEAPIVILALSSDFKQGASSSVIYHNGTAQKWAFKLDNFSFNDVYQKESKNEQDASKNEQDAFKNEQQILDAEKARLRYVAATRASNVLIIPKETDAQGKSRGFWEKLFGNMPEKHKIFDLIAFPVSKDKEEEAPACAEAEPQTSEEASTTTVFTASTSANPSYKIELPSKAKLKLPRKVAEDIAEDTTKDLAEDVAEETKPDSLADPSGSTSTKPVSVSLNPALRGTLIHRLMEVLVTSKNQGDLNDIVRQIIKEYDGTSAEYETELLTVGEQIRNGGYPQKNEAPQDILTELLSAEQVICEMPFCYRKKNFNAEKKNSAGEKKNSDENVVMYQNGVMDVLYYKSGEWHIIDYKTNEESNGLDEEYAEQLKAYADAFREMNGKEADAKIYHIG